MSKSKGLHPNNPHNQKYDFEALVDSSPKLSEYLIINKYDDTTIDFSNPSSVMALNQALLSHFYHIKNWTIPKGHLCPPIPGRADYIHYIADLLDTTTPKIGLDIGTGTGCIYPILGAHIYNFQFVATDIAASSIESAQSIIDSNPGLKNKIELRLQNSPDYIFKDIIKDQEIFDFTLCNPPFHSSLEEASIGSTRKRKNLAKNRHKKGHDNNGTTNELNFGGINAELWCAGGELAFIKKMITESVIYKSNVKLFTTLVSKKQHLHELEIELRNAKAKNIRKIQMQTGQKISHILAWTW